MIKSLNKLRRIRVFMVGIKRKILQKVWGMDIHDTTEMSLSAKFDRTYPKGIHVGAYSYVAFNARILTHDMTRNVRLDTRIGENCFIGGQSLILPGVTIGDQCIVGAGSVVTKSVPSNTIVAGNPAKVLRENVKLLSFGRIDPEWDKARKRKSSPQTRLRLRRQRSETGVPVGGICDDRTPLRPDDHRTGDHSPVSFSRSAQPHCARTVSNRPAKPGNGDGHRHQFKHAIRLAGGDG